MINKAIVALLKKECIKAKKYNNIPIAAALIDKHQNIVAISANNKNQSKIVFDHAEIRSIAQANKLKKQWRLSDLTLITTSEPCHMCRAVITEARIKHVIALSRKEYHIAIVEEFLSKGINYELHEISFFRNIIKDFFEKKRK